MKKLLHTKAGLLSCLLVSLLIISSCHKESQNDPPQPNGPNEALVSKVNAWLNEQKTKVTGDRPLKIDLLQQNIDWQTLHEEVLYEGEMMIVASVKPAFQTVNNKGKNPKNYLLMIVNKNGKIRKGNIVQFIPAENSAFKELKNGFFNKFYGLNMTDLNGTLTFLTVSDDLLFELRYEKGLMKSHSEVERKAKAAGSGRINIECYDVWWVTYYPDGSSTWEYLYSFCNGGEQPCKGDINTNGRVYRVGCGGGSGGEGGEEEQNVAAQRDWIKASNSSGFWHIISTESFNGVKKTNGNNYFTGVTHLNSHIVAAGSGFSWSQSACTTTFTNSDATIYLAGTVTAPSGEQVYISSTPAAIFTFQQIFP